MSSPCHFPRCRSFFINLLDFLDFQLWYEKILSRFRKRKPSQLMNDVADVKAERLTISSNLHRFAKMIGRESAAAKGRTSLSSSILARAARSIQFWVESHLQLILRNPWRATSETWRFYMFLVSTVMALPSILNRRWRWWCRSKTDEGGRIHADKAQPGSGVDASKGNAPRKDMRVFSVKTAAAGSHCLPN